jgi:hypothetical protein
LGSGRRGTKQRRLHPEAGVAQRALGLGQRQAAQIGHAGARLGVVAMHVDLDLGAGCQAGRM